MNIFTSFYIHVAEMISSELNVCKVFDPHSSQGQFVYELHLVLNIYFNEDIAK